MKTPSVRAVLGLAHLAAHLITSITNTYFSFPTCNRGKWAKRAIEDFV
jgi:hypothetical protein